MSQLALRLLLALPLLAIAVVGGYAWKGVVGAVVGVVAVAAFEVVFALPRIRPILGNRRLQPAFPIVMTVVAAGIGYAGLGGVGLVLMAIFAGFGNWVGYRLGRRYVEDNEYWLRYRRSDRR